MAKFDVFAAESAINTINTRVDKIKEDSQQLELAKLQVQSQLPIGMGVEWGKGAYGETTGKLIPIGEADPRYQLAIAQAKAEAKIRADAAVEQARQTLPFDIQLQQERNKPDLADQSQQFWSSLANETQQFLSSLATQGGQNARAQFEADEAMKRTLIQQGFYPGLDVEVQQPVVTPETAAGVQQTQPISTPESRAGARFVPLPLTPQKKQEAKDKRLGAISDDIKGFLTGATPQPGLALEALGRVKGRGPKVQRAAQSIQEGKQGLSVSETGAGRGTTALGVAFQRVDEFIKEELGDTLGEFTTDVQKGKSTKTPLESAAVRDQINRKLDEARSAFATSVRALFPGQEQAQQYYLSQFDQHAAEYGTGFTPAELQPEPTVSGASEKQTTEFIAQGGNQDILHYIGRIKEVAREGTTKEGGTQHIPLNPHAIEMGVGFRRTPSKYRDEAILSARQFLKLPPDRQYQILARRILSGKMPNLNPPGVGRPQRRLQAPIPPPTRR